MFLTQTCIWLLLESVLLNQIKYLHLFYLEIALHCSCFLLFSISKWNFENICFPGTSLYCGKTLVLPGSLSTKELELHYNINVFSFHVKTEYKNNISIYIVREPFVFNVWTVNKQVWDRWFFCTGRLASKWNTPARLFFFPEYVFGGVGF